MRAGVERFMGDAASSRVAAFPAERRRLLKKSRMTIQNYYHIFGFGSRNIPWLVEFPEGARHPLRDFPQRLPRSDVLAGLPARLHRASPPRQSSSCQMTALLQLSLLIPCTTGRGLTEQVK